MLSEPLFWVTLSFGLFVLIFLKFGKGPLFAKLDSKIAEIKREIETANALRVEAQGLLTQYQSRQRDAAKEAQAIIDNAKRHADEIRRSAEQDLKEAATRREQQLQDRLRRVEENALAEIRAYAAELAVKATKEIIAEKMDEKTNARLVEASVKQVAGQLG